MHHDYHTHSTYSDGSDLESMVQAAVDTGLDGLGISDHANPPSDTWGFVESYPERREDIEALRGKYDIEIFDGVEVDYYPDEEDTIESFLETADFDYALGSVHHVEQLEVMSPTDFVDYDEDQKISTVDQYVTVLESLVRSELFDVVAHLDVFERNPQLRGLASEEHYEALAEALVDSGTYPEVNAGRVFEEYGKLHPRPSFLSVLADYDVAFVPGSDSHTPDELRDRVPHLREFFETGDIRLAHLPL